MEAITANAYSLIISDWSDISASCYNKNSMILFAGGHANIRERADNQIVNQAGNFAIKDPAFGGLA